jgi:hypothetical protein
MRTPHRERAKSFGFSSALSRVVTPRYRRANKPSGAGNAKGRLALDLATP